MSAADIPPPRQRSPLAGAMAAGRYGAAGPDPLVLREVPSSIVELGIRRGRSDELRAAIRRAFGLELPRPGRTIDAGSGSVIWIRPDTWLVMAARGPEGALAGRVKAIVGDAGSVVDQTHGKTVLNLAGEAAPLALRKGCRLDLDPSAFPAGATAVTQIAHVGCILHRREGDAGFDLTVSSSYAVPFFEWLCASAAEFGYEVR